MKRTLWCVTYKVGRLKPSRLDFGIFNRRNPSPSPGELGPLLRRLSLWFNNNRTGVLQAKFMTYIAFHTRIHKSTINLCYDKKVVQKRTVISIGKRIKPRIRTLKKIKFLTIFIIRIITTTNFEFVKTLYTLIGLHVQTTEVCISVFIFSFREESEVKLNCSSKYKLCKSSKQKG